MSRWTTTATGVDVTTPSPEYAAGLLTALGRPCPVRSCLAPIGAVCTTPMTIRAAHGTKEAPTPMVLTGPHYERVLNIPVSN